MNSITEDFKNYKKSEIENLLYMRVDELIAPGTLCCYR